MKKITGLNDNFKKIDKSDFMLPNGYMPNVRDVFVLYCETAIITKQSQIPAMVVGGKIYSEKSNEITLDDSDFLVLQQVMQSANIPNWIATAMVSIKMSDVMSAIEVVHTKKE